jgi:hypothetical protein
MTNMVEPNKYGRAYYITHGTVNFRHEGSWQYYGHPVFELAPAQQVGREDVRESNFLEGVGRYPVSQKTRTVSTEPFPRSTNTACRFVAREVKNR